MIEVIDLKKYFTYKKKPFSFQKGVIKSLDGVSFSIKQGETFAVVGESGSGKTTLIKTMLQLEKPTAGDVTFHGQSVVDLKRKDLQKLTTNMQIVFQDPYGALDPKWTIEKSLLEPLQTHLKLSKKEMLDRVHDMIKLVGLTPNHLKRFPKELSGGQRQRVVIARALILKPKFIVLDEPVSALDVSIQAQILNLMKQLQQQLDLTYLFVSHDLSVVRFISDTVGVMYLGKMVEIGPTEQLFDDPKHPYTKALLQAVPSLDNELTDDNVLKGEIPSPRKPPAGCAFHTRCPFAMPQCKTDTPIMKPIGEQQVACHLY